MNLSLNARKGFTLVELLVAITVIAILGGMLVYGLFPVLNRAQEMAAYTELTQMEQAIEQFKTKYGFYPPSFRSLNADSFGRYVNRISPNHQENVAAWWSSVGTQIQNEPGSDLVFWLSGLFQNRQFPLTGRFPNPVQKAYAASDLPDYPERQIFFEFKSDRLFPPPESTPIAVGYLQHGDDSTSRFRYLDASNYSNTLAGHWNAYLDEAGIPFNPQTFQLCAPGRDKMIGFGGGINALYVEPGTPPKVPDLDNLCNFAGGTLEAFKNSRSD